MTSIYTHTRPETQRREILRGPAAMASVAGTGSAIREPHRAVEPAVDTAGSQGGSV